MIKLDIVVQEIHDNNIETLEDASEQFSYIRGLPLHVGLGQRHVLRGAIVLYGIDKECSRDLILLEYLASFFHNLRLRLTFTSQNPNIACKDKLSIVDCNYYVRHDVGVVPTSWP